MSKFNKNGKNLDPKRQKEWLGQNTLPKPEAVTAEEDPKPEPKAEGKQAKGDKPEDKPKGRMRNVMPRRNRKENTNG